MSRSNNRADVSVVIPTYQRRRQVVRAVRSVLEQEMPPAEIIVVDDGSTDGTDVELKRQFVSEICYLRKKNGGAASARNSGINASNYELVSFLDSDDRWLPEMLSTLVPILERFPGVVVICSDWLAGEGDSCGRFAQLGLSLKTGVTQFQRPLRHLLRRKGHGILLQTSAIRKKALIAVQGFDESFRIAEDTKLFISLALLGPFAIYNKPLANQPLAIKIDGLGAEQLTQITAESWHREHLEMVFRIFDELGREILRADRIAYLRMHRLAGYFFGKLGVEEAKNGNIYIWLKLLARALLRGELRLSIKSAYAHIFRVA